MEVRWDEKTKTWSMHAFEKKNFSRPKVMVKSTYVVAGAILALVTLMWFFSPGPKSVVSRTPTCPRGYYYQVPASTWAGWDRPCVPIGEDSSLDGVPAVRLS
jgi:hypothetical protein